VQLLLLIAVTAVWGVTFVQVKDASSAFCSSRWHSASSRCRISATRIALVFSLETVWAGFFGYLLADDRLGLLGWGGCA